MAVFALNVSALSVRRPTSCNLPVIANVRIVPKKLVKDPSTIMDEINVLKNLDNPHIVHVWDHFESRDKYYIAFELAIGGELFDRITERGRFTEKDAGDCIR